MVLELAWKWDLSCNIWDTRASSCIVSVCLGVSFCYGCIVTCIFGVFGSHFSVKLYTRGLFPLADRSPLESCDLAFCILAFSGARVYLACPVWKVSFTALHTYLGGT